MKKILVLLGVVLFMSACGTSEVAEVQSVDCITKNSLVSDGAILIDVRSSLEYDQGHLDNSINIAVDVLESTIESEVSDKDTKIIVYCRSGNRSATAARTLVNMGYKNVYDLGAMDSCN